MKKIQLFILAMCIGFASFSQAINDQAVIPVSVTLNSIMRLQVVSGGNIEFVFNTIESYTTGIFSSARTQTAFTVASSVNFDVTLNLEDNTGWIGEANGGLMNLGAIRFLLTETAGNGNSTLQHDGVQLAVQDAETIIAAGALDNGGLAHTFTMDWECGTTTPNTMVELNLPADRYSNNVFLTLTQAP